MSVTKPNFVRVKESARRALPALLLAGFSVEEASNLNFLNDTPMTYIKKPDMDAIKVALIDVFNKKKDGEPTRWHNEGTGNSVKIASTMTPEKQFRKWENRAALFPHPDCERAANGASLKVLRNQPD